MREEHLEKSGEGPSEFKEYTDIKTGEIIKEEPPKEEEPVTTEERGQKLEEELSEASEYDNVIVFHERYLRLKEKDKEIIKERIEKGLLEKEKGEELIALKDKLITDSARIIAETQHRKEQARIEAKYEIERLRELPPEDRPKRIESNLRKIKEIEQKMRTEFSEKPLRKGLSEEGFIEMHTKPFRRENQILEALRGEEEILEALERGEEIK